LTRLRESPRCLPAARSAAACEHTSLSRAARSGHREPTLGSLLVLTNLAPPLTRILRLLVLAVAEVVSEAVVRLRDGRQIRTIRTTGGVDRAREVTAGGFLIWTSPEKRWAAG
jgi:hypothetical protein